METLKFKKLDWFEKIVNNLLIDQAKILDNWRKQTLTKSQRVKNFENWLLVELVCKLQEKGVKNIKTNGIIQPRSYKEMPKLKGRKGKSHSISPDISFKFPDSDLILNVEIKTQSGFQEIINDIVLVKHHNNEEKLLNYKSCFLWVIISPNDHVLSQRVWSNTEKAIEKIHMQIGVALKLIEINPWLKYCLATPGIKYS